MDDSTAVALLAAQVQQLTAEIQQLRAKAPEKTTGWLTTGAIGKQVGLTGRTIAVWIADGRIPEKFVRKVPRGSGFLYRLHAEPTVAHIRKVLSGEV